MSSAPLLAVLVSLVAVPLILLSSNRPNLREFWTIAAGVLKFLFVLTLIPNALEGNGVEVTLFEIAPDVPLFLNADPFGVYFALVASGLWIFTSFFSIGYMRGLEEEKQTRYFASFAACLSATIGIAFSGNLLTFLLFYEILTLATYPLVIHNETEEAIISGRKYLAYTLTAGLLLLAGTALTYHLTGTMSFETGGIFDDPGNYSKGTMLALFFLFVGGVGVKAGLMPLHSWLPSAMVAPTPVSALLHAVAVVKSGVFGVIRIVGFVFGPGVMSQFGLSTILMILAGITIIVASLLAFRQDHLKRRLAYSTVGHLSYIILGATLLTQIGMTGAVMHIAAHATMKITLFFCAGAIHVNLHRDYISNLNGIADAMPWTMGAFVVGSMGLAGIPPINGFLSKWYLGLGSLEGNMIIPVLILVISGLLNAGYFFPIIWRAYFKKGDVGVENEGEASPFMVVPIVGTAAASVLFGLFPDLFLNMFKLASRVGTEIFNGGTV